MPVPRRIHTARGDNSASSLVRRIWSLSFWRQVRQTGFKSKAALESMFASVPLIPNFAPEDAARPSKRRNRDTTAEHHGCKGADYAVEQSSATDDPRQPLVRCLPVALDDLLVRTGDAGAAPR